MNIWKVGQGESAIYFETANEAIEYIITMPTSRSITKTEDENRTVTLMRPVLAEGSDGIVDDTYEKYVEDDELRGSISVPSTFTGSLCIDFNGYRYDFSNTNEAFFVIEGGENVYIYNGTSVIFNEASHVPYAITVNTETVTIDEHLLDDRRTNPKALNVKEEGSVVITSSTTRKDTSIKGDFNVEGKLSIEDGIVYIESIETSTDSSFSITGGEIHNPHEYDSVVNSAIDENEFSKNGGEHQIIHSMTHYNYVKATCTEPGHIEYWQCSVCNKCFKDSEGTTQIDEASTVLEKLGHDWATTWSSDNSSHWYACKREGCTARKDEAEHTNEYYYSCIVTSGSPFLTISHKCKYCDREVSTEHKEEDSVFHLTPLDGFKYDYDRNTGVATITISTTTNYTSCIWYDINGDVIEILSSHSSFSFTPDGKYAFRCELLDENNTVIESCYIELKQYKN